MCRRGELSEEKDDNGRFFTERVEFCSLSREFTNRFCTISTIYGYTTTVLHSGISVFVVSAILMLITEILHTHTYMTLVTVFTLGTFVTLLSTQVRKILHSRSKIFQ
jgi:hypothetical protein